MLYLEMLSGIDLYLIHNGVVIGSYTLLLFMKQDEVDIYDNPSTIACVPYGHFST